MSPPFLRLVRRIAAPGRGESEVWDLRIAQPNVSHIPMATVHSLEHFLGSWFLAHPTPVVNVAPMGCQTGFYLVTNESLSREQLESHLVPALEAVALASEVPLANPIECGWAEHHSLGGAQRVASWLLLNRRHWHEAVVELPLP